MNESMKRLLAIKTAVDGMIEIRNDVIEGGDASMNQYADDISALADMIHDDIAEDDGAVWGDLTHELLDAFTDFILNR